jgi:chemotaxis protein methyltransferase CheR
MQTARPTYDRFRQIVRSRTGINLDSGKSHLIEQRLRRRVMAHDLPDADAYLRLILDRQDMAEELTRALDLITTNTTSFFREAMHFTHLTEQVLPRILSRPGPRGRPRLKLWSAAASDGAEAYSAAMVLAEARRAGKMFDFAILGTDISGRMVEKARAGIYPVADLGTVPEDLRRRWFLSSDAPEDRNLRRIAPELRARTSFRQYNLIDPASSVDRDVDVIFLRNVLIYFDPSTQAAVLARMASHLATGGHLFVGHSESMVVRHPDLRQVCPTIFTKV